MHLTTDFSLLSSTKLQNSNDLLTPSSSVLYRLLKVISFRSEE